MNVAQKKVLITGANRASVRLLSTRRSAYNRVRTQFSESQISELTFAIGVINLWNRLNISFRTVPGSPTKCWG